MITAGVRGEGPVGTDRDRLPLQTSDLQGPIGTDYLKITRRGRARGANPTKTVPTRPQGPIGTDRDRFWGMTPYTRACVYARLRGSTRKTVPNRPCCTSKPRQRR